MRIGNNQVESVFVMKKITEASAQKAFTLFLRFDDGTSGVVDLSDLAGRGVFASWENQGAFENPAFIQI